MLGRLRQGRVQAQFASMQYLGRRQVAWQVQVSWVMLDMWIYGMSYPAESTGTLRLLVLPAMVQRTRLASENSKNIPLRSEHTDQTRAYSIRDRYE